MLAIKQKERNTMDAVKPIQSADTTADEKKDAAKTTQPDTTHGNK
jgi:hypothetical protein